MPKPTDTIFLRVGAKVLPGVPARFGQYMVIRDDGPRHRMTVRVGSSQAEALASEPVGFLEIAFIRSLFGAAIYDDEELEARWSGVIDFDRALKRHRSIQSMPPPGVKRRTRPLPPTGPPAA